jgi:hypothetical protein
MQITLSKKNAARLTAAARLTGLSLRGLGSPLGLPNKRRRQSCCNPKRQEHDASELQ